MKPFDFTKVGKQWPPSPSFNMRRRLAEHAGERKLFRATFVRWGKKTNFKGHSEETLLFQDVIDLGTTKVITDHLWFSYTKGFEKIQLRPGSIVEFDARVKEYKKGYVNKRYGINEGSKDFKLSHPTNIILAKAI